MTSPADLSNAPSSLDFAPNVATSYKAIDVAKAYGAPTSQYDGTGITVGIVELGGGYRASDMTTAGLNPAKVTLVSVDGAASNPGADTSADSEVALDVQVVAGVAPAANIRVYFAPNSVQGFVDATQQAVNECHVVSISWGTQETGSAWTTTNRPSMSTVLSTARTNKIPVFIASGDKGSRDGTGADVVQYPASDPNGIGCGGTELRLTGGGARDTEVAWDENDTTAASGGGVSTVFSNRHVPDVAGNASGQTAYQIVLNGTVNNIYGTSAVAPLFAGCYALLRQAVGRSFDFLNACTAHPTALFDVVTGDNGTYQAGAGRDDVTGLGVPDFGVLLANVAVARTITDAAGAVDRITRSPAATPVGFAAPISTAAPSTTAFPSQTNPLVPTRSATMGSVWSSIPGPTNTWYEDWIVDGAEGVSSFNGPSSKKLNIFPYMLRRQTAGLDVCIPKNATVFTDNAIINEMRRDMSLYSVETTSAPVFTAADFYGVTLKWAVDATHHMSAPVVRGMAYTTMVYNGLTPKLYTGAANASFPGDADNHTRSITSVNGSTSGTVTGTRFVVVTQGVARAGYPTLTSPPVEYTDTQTWVLYASSSLSLTIGSVALANNATAGTLTATGAYTGTLRLARLQTADGGAESAVYDAHAARVPTGGALDVTYGSSSATATITWATTGSGPLLTFALPHHQDTLVAPTYAAVTWSTLRGTMRAVDGLTWQTTETLPTIAWQAAESIPSGKVAAITSQLATDADYPSPSSIAADIYNAGKELGALARLVLIADQLGDVTKRTALLTKLRTGLTPFFDGVSAKFYYDTTWGGVPFLPARNNGGSDFGNGYYNDHHFHHGYLVYAAAVIARYDTTWAGTYQAAVNVLIRDVANPSTADNYFPQWRYVDWFEGHTWPTGLASVEDGRGAESTSEAVNFWYAMALWGSAIGNSDMTNNGRLGLAQEIRTAQKYWHMPTSSDVYPAGTMKSKKTIGIVHQNKVTTDTYFGSNPEYHTNIQAIPHTPISENLLDATWAGEAWTSRLEPTVSTSDVTWRGYSRALQAVNDSDAAFTAIQALTGSTGTDPTQWDWIGTTKTNLLWWAATRPAVAPTGPVSYTRTLTDSAGAADSVSAVGGSTSYTRTITDSAGAADSVGSVGGSSPTSTFSDPISTSAPPFSTSPGAHSIAASNYYTWSVTGKQMPTNAWWENLLIPYVDGGTYNGKTNTFPYAQWPATNDKGLTTSYHGAEGRSVAANSITLSAVQEVGLEVDNAVTAREIIDYTDLGVSLRWTTAAGAMTCHLVEGMGFNSAVYAGATPVFRTQHPITAINGAAPSGSYTGTKFKIQTSYNSRVWVLYSSSLITLNYTSQLLTASAGFTGSLQFAYLPSTAQEADYDGASTAVLTGGNVSATYAGNNATLTFTWSSTGTGAPLVMTLPHHQDAMPSATYTAISLLSLKGTQRGIRASSWTMTEPLTTITWNPPITPSSGAITDISAALEVEKNSTYDWVGQGYGVSPYYGGKYVAKLARLVAIAQQIGSTSTANALLTRLRNEISSYLTATHTGTAGVNGSGYVNALQYKGGATWRGIATENGWADMGADFGSGRFNDHHFHYGYWIYAAAVAGKDDATWRASIAPYITGLIRDIANPSHADTYFPKWRHKDWFHGHSWASGLVGLDVGPDQESVSEACNAWHGIQLWGEATGNTTLRDLGRVMLATEVRAAKKYWHIYDSTVYPAPFSNEAVAVSVRTHKVARETFFGNRQEYFYGIEAMPYTPAAELYDDAAWVTRGYASAATNIPVTPTGNPQDTGWNAVIYGLLAVTDPTAGYNAIQALPLTQISSYTSHTQYGPDFDNGQSKAAMLQWAATRSTVIEGTNYTRTITDPAGAGDSVASAGGSTSHTRTILDLAGAGDTLARSVASGTGLLSSFVDKFDTAPISGQWTVNGAGVTAAGGQATALLELGAQGWRDETAATQVGSGNLGAPFMRVEFLISELTLATTVADYCNAHNIRLQPLIGWDNGVAAPDLTGLSSWASTLGPGGTHWGGASPVAAIRDIELGNENSMFYKSGLPGDAGYQNLATTYGQRALAAAQAINTANSQVGVLVELEGGDSNQSVWIDKVLAAGGATLKSLMHGPVIHLYGPDWQTKLNLNRGFLANQGVTKPYFVTETGISTDNGRTLSDNYGWPTNLTYAQAATNHQTVLETMAGMTDKIRQVSVYNDHDTANPGASSDREAYFGITTAPFGDKGAVTSYFRTAFAKYRGGTTSPAADGQLYVNASHNAGVAVFSSARSTLGYTFTGSSLTFELKAVPGVVGDTANAQMWVQDPTPTDTVDRIGFEYVAATNTLDFIGQTGATYAPIGTTTSLTYDAVAHRWLRIAHSGTAITWQTSSDGLAWTTRRTLSTGIPAWTSKTTLIVSFEAFRTTGTNDTLRIDNVNTTAATTTTPPPGTGTAPVGTDALQRRTLNELRAWKSWLAANGATGLVGEFNGVTLFRKYNDVPQGQQWDDLLDIYLRELDYQSIHSAAWASGRNWGQGYPLGIHVGVNAGDPLTIANQNASQVLANHPTRSGVLRAVNLSGHEEGITINGGGTVRTGSPYLHTVADFQFLATNGVDTIRLPLAWERLQPTLSTALSTTALGALDTMLGAARQVGIRVMLDCHNYGRYTLADGSVYTLGGNLTNAMLSDFWTRLSTWVRADTSRSSTVVAYALMNEPHSLAGGAPTWEASSQDALSAIRTGGDNRLIFVGGYTFSSLTEWSTWHHDGWITDSANNFAYEAHHYWDTQSALGSRSGSYQQSPTGPIETYAIELQAAVNTEGTPPAAPSVSAGADATVGFGSTFARTAVETGVAIASRSWTVVSGPMGAGTTLATGTASLSWLPGSSPVGATDIRFPTFAEMAFEMTSTAENSTLDWTSSYGYIEDIDDGRGYTAGIVGFCSGTGDMLTLVRHYADIAPGNELQGYISGLEQTTAVGQGDGASNAATTYLGTPFITAWKNSANNDPKFRQAQRDSRDSGYWSPALTQALADGVGPLGLAILYDISVNHGAGDQPEAFGGIVASAHAAASPPSSGGNEKAYLQALIDERVAILQGWGALQANGRQTIHQTLLDSGNLQLEGTVSWSVYGDDFTMGPRPNPPQDAVRGTYVLRYSATNDAGTGTDDVSVAVIDPLPEGGDNGTDPVIVQTLTVYGNAVGPLVTETFTPAAGEVLVVKAATGHSLNTIAGGAAAGGGLVYHERGGVTATNYCQARLWTTTVGSSPVAMSVSVTTAGTAYSPTLIVERWHNVAIAA